MNEIREWSFEGAGIFTTEINGEPWFFAKEIASALGYSNTRDALSKHVDDEDKGVAKRDTPGGRQQVTVINESGVYALIFGSKLESAKRFKRWVTAEVLPAIRKYGGYGKPAITKPDSYMIDDRRERALRWIEETQEWQDKVNGLQDKIAAQEPKVALAEAITASPGCILIGELAKLLRQNGVETGQRRLFKWMRDNEWLCSGKAEHNHPTQRAIERGYMVLQERILRIEGKEVSRFTPMITGAGQEFFINLLIDKK